MKSFLILRRRYAAFTLFEMIGVLAIMAILAAVLVPNGVRMIDRAAVNAEQQTMSNLGKQVRKYLFDYGSPPAAGTWAADVATYSDIGVQSITTNTRQMNRVYFLDPDPLAPNQRAIILSSMRQGMTLPTTMTTLQFDALWRTVDGQTPSAASWAGWTAMAADFLVIERINFKSEYRAVLLWNNSSASTPPAATSLAYEVRNSKGLLIQGGTVSSNPGTNSVTLSLVPNARLNLYAGPAAVGVVDYSYVVNGSPKTFEFKNLHWSSQ